MQRLSRLFKLGLTGGIGSGKSTVATCLNTLGARTIDADTISRQTTAAGGSAISAIRQLFGEQYISDGSLDRDRMRQAIFSAPSARAQLEAIVHPLVGAEIARQTQQAADSGCRVLVFDIPLLVESGRWRGQLDQICVIDCSVATQITRVMNRSGFSADAVQQVIDAQAPRRARLAAADTVIFNDGISIQQLHTEVQQLANTLGL